MKTRILVLLALAALLMVPAVAQQNTQSQPIPQSGTTADQGQAAPAAAPGQQLDNGQATQKTDKDQATMASGKQPLVYESRQGFWGKINPFARKKYVQKQLNPIRDRVNELDELTAANSKMITDVDSRAQEGIRQASAKASEADSHAVDAGNRAQQANQTAQLATNRLQTVETVVGNLDQYTPATQVELRFVPGQLALSKKAKDAIDDMATQLKDKKGYVVEVQGFSSGKGPEAIRNSQQMAQSVVRYLVLNHDVPVYRIYTLGMGNAPLPASAEGGKTRRTRGGRVEISLMTNGVDQLSSNRATLPASDMSAPATQPAAPATTQPPAQQTPDQTPPVPPAQPPLL